MSENIDKIHACEQWLYGWMRPESGIQGKWINGVLIDYVWPVTGTLRWSHHLRHCAQWGFLGPPDVVRGTMVWNSYSVSQPIILSSPLRLLLLL